ncbi:MAG: hypothetical protein QXI60_01405 [Thermofilaceae archaeon]
MHLILQAAASDKGTTLINVNSWKNSIKTITLLQLSELPPSDLLRRISSTQTGGI